MIGRRDAGATMIGRRDAGATMVGRRDAGATMVGRRDAGAWSIGRGAGGFCDRAEGGQVFGGSALPPEDAVGDRNAEVAGDFGDDVLDGPGPEVVLGFRGVEAVAQLGPQGGSGFGRGFTLDGVLDFPEDALSGGLPGLGGVGLGGFAECPAEEDGSADAAGGAVEGEAQGLQLFGGGGRGVGGAGPGDVVVEGLSDVGGEAEQPVQRGAVEFGVFGLLVGGGGCLFAHDPVIGT